MSVSEVTCNELLKTVIKSCCRTGFPIIFGCLESWLVHRFGTDAHRMFTSSRWSMMAAATPLMSDVMLAVAGDNAYDFLIFYVLHIFSIFEILKYLCFKYANICLMFSLYMFGFNQKYWLFIDDTVCSYSKQITSHLCEMTRFCFFANFVFKRINA